MVKVRFPLAGAIANALGLRRSPLDREVRLANQALLVQIFAMGSRGGKMKCGLLALFGAVSVLALAAVPASAALKDENILLPMPDGFKIGHHAEDSRMMMSEFIPAGETVDRWSRIVTEIVNRGVGPVDGEQLQAMMLAQWKGACPGADGRRIDGGLENGYAASYWEFNCPMNPQSRQSESMVRKVLVGKDAVYDVQYAYKKISDPDLLRTATQYLREVTICDTRAPDHPCPAGLTSAQPAAAQSHNPVEDFLHAADDNDLAAMKASIDPKSAKIFTTIANCYLRRVYNNEQTHEIIAAWMCADGPSRSRVVLATVSTTSKGRVAVSLMQNQSNDRPAPPRSGSAFEK